MAKIKRHKSKKWQKSNKRVKSGFMTHHQWQKRVLGLSALALLAVVMVVQSHRNESHATSILLRQRLIDASSHTYVESQGGSTFDGSAPALATVANVAKVAQHAKVATIQSKGQHVARQDIAAVTQAERKLKERNNQLASERKVVQTEKTQLTVKKEIDSVEAEQRAVEHKLAQEDTRRWAEWTVAGRAQCSNESCGSDKSDCGWTQEGCTRGGHSRGICINATGAAA